MRYAESENPVESTTQREARRWRAMWETFHAVLTAPEAERESLLIARCGADTALREEVKALLRSHDTLGDFLETSGHLPRREPRRGSSLPAGTDLGPFVIERWIGEGGMGVVYEARQKRPERRVALKLVRDWLAGADFRDRYEREVATLGRLNHPGIAILYDANVLHTGSGVEQPYIAMELVEGRPLLEYAQLQNLAREKRLDLLAKVADAVYHANQRGVLHCDLKPSNIMVTPAGQPKILDFGVARFMDDASLSVTRSHAVMDGTLPYMSPERFSGDPGQISALIDVYSLGVLGYQLLSGRLPFQETSSLFAMMEQIRTGRSVRLREVDASFDRDIESVVHLAFHPDMQRRYQSAADFTAELRRILNHEAIIGEPRNWWYRARRLARRNRTAVGAATVVLIALIAATAISARQAVRATLAEQRSQRNVDTLWAFAKQVLYEMHDGIASLPGSTPVRRELMEAARANLEQIRADAGDDPAFLLDLALAYERLGDVLGNTKMFNLGDVDAARASYDTALSLLERLAARYPQDIAIAHAYARLHIRRAEAAGPGEGAAEDPGLIPHLVRGVDMLRSVVQHTDLPEARLDLVHALIIDGLERQCEGDVEAMLERGREAMRLTEQLCEARPGDTSILFERYTAASWYGEMLLLADRPREAVESLAPAADWLRHHGQAHADDPRIGHQRVLTASRLAIARQKAGDVDRGLLDGANVISLAAALAAANPDDQRIVRAHEICVVWLAGAHLEAGDDAGRNAEVRREHYAQGAALFREAIALLAARQARGWVPHWESDYPEEYAGGLTRCEQALAAMK